MGILTGKIEHIVVLMMENRSFDSLVGGLYPKSARFNGISGSESNPWQGQKDIKIWCNEEGVDNASMTIPDPDPGELWNDINTQLFGLDAQANNQSPPMNGFVNNYMRQNQNSSKEYSPAAVMHYYTPSQVPVISQLARQFAVCDQWFASAPCQTWPNRFFVHTGTAQGYENNSPVHFPYLMDTIFNRLQSAHKSWGIYYHDFPQSIALTKLWDHLDHFHSFDNFLEQAAKGSLPAYSFIEPRYFPGIKLPNDQHPPHNVGLGEQLISQVYNTLRKAPTWSKTLFILTYDEHGGCYDHAPPPLAVPPDNHPTTPFAFDRYGIRVPAVIISPYIRPGTILRSVANGDLPHHGPPYPFDHTSIIAAVRKCFNLQAPLSHRDAVAPDLEICLNLENPDNNPATIEALPYAMTSAELERAMAAPMNDMQVALHHTAAHLPDSQEEAGEHIRQLVMGFKKAHVPLHFTAAQALPFMKTKLGTFLKKRQSHKSDAHTLIES
jgi:phospholipase C